ncbi:rod shape-determining protein MreC [Desulfobulbus propionicus DSM 2032]|jgi:rod shape-determining protein MreC|uniref:Cell shape-determining protein MreC n=1 Tax=Desulfobulbus propionicus (strain ATCC 33891 / DSM 2032 / VKM B-1956 / 1pr3) TaxID=577650 RepID=A0A7U4DND8_DESPD|nr:rod shape-determining protein MreC [Desulfobulbus propionicus]ADW16929.1 rod shape-determining protein MreC [Desulfobulbus propionicus DSM 2032]
MRKKSSRKRSDHFRLFRIVLLAGFLLTSAFIFLVSTLGSQNFGSLHKLILEAAGPLQKFVAIGSASVEKFKSEYIDILQDSLRLREENKRLVQQLQENEQLLNKSREAMATNASLRKLLEFKNTLGEQSSVAATIIGKDPSAMFRSVIIDQGSNSGIMKGDPVVNNDGVVGQVFTITPNYAKVLLAIAPSSAIDVLLQETRVRGILKGNGTLTYRLEYILKTAEVKEGDHVVTAGYGGVFPTGLQVGVVSKIIKKPRGMFHEIEVTPSVDYQKLENLLILHQPNMIEIKQMAQP